MREIRRKAFGCGAVPEHLTGPAFILESGADTIVIEDLPFTPTSGGVIAYCLRADDQTIAVEGDTDTDGAAVITLDADCYHVAGKIVISVYITDTDGNVQCVYCMVGSVYRAQSGTILDSGVTVPSLAQLTAVYESCQSIVSGFSAATVAETKTYLGI